MLAPGNVLSPAILCFLRGPGVALARSDLSFPQAAAKEAPAIVSALWLASRATGKAGGASGELLREIPPNGAIVLLMGAFAIGWISGAKGKVEVDPFISAPFKGVLGLFLLDSFSNLICGSARPTPMPQER